MIANGKLEETFKFGGQDLPCQAALAPPPPRAAADSELMPPPAMKLAAKQRRARVCAV